MGSKDPLGDFLAINQELELFNPKLASKPQVGSAMLCSDSMFDMIFCDKNRCIIVYD
jgi:hypothetical protein